MKRIITLALAAALFVGVTTKQSEAVEVQISGAYTNIFSGYDALNLSKDSIEGETHSGFDVFQRFQVNMNLIMSESLSATLMFRAPHRSAWGDGSFGIAGGTSVFQVKQSYLTWMVPDTNTRVRMGLQSVTFPSMMGLGTNAIQDDNIPGVTINAPINDMLTVDAAWLRASSGYSTGNFDDSAWRLNDSYADVFYLALPMTFENAKITPWAAYAKTGSDVVGAHPSQAGTNSDFMVLGKDTIWAALNTEFSFNSLTFYADFIYANANKYNNVGYKYNSYMVDAAVEYTTDYGTPKLYGWYASGDSASDLAKGKSGIMPNISPAWGTGGTSAFYDRAQHSIAPNAGVFTPTGSWAIGVAYTGYQAMENLALGASVTYINGTNDKDVVGGMFNPEYMSTNDSVTEFSVTGLYDIYANLQAGVEVNYLLSNIDDKLYTSDGKNGFRGNMSFKYNF